MEGGSENGIIMANADFVDTFGGGHHKTIFVFIFMHLQVFLSSMYRTGIFFMGCLFVVVVLGFFFLGGGVGGKR